MNNFIKFCNHLLFEAFSDIPSILNVNKIKKDLINEYKKKQNYLASKNMKHDQYIYRSGEEDQILFTLKALINRSKYYEEAFNNYNKNPKLLNTMLQNDEANWENTIKSPNVLKLRSIGKLLLLKYLKQYWKWTVPITYNETGEPVYKFHKLNKLLQIHILQNLNIDENTKNKIYNVILDENTVEALKNELKGYIGIPSEIIKNKTKSDLPKVDVPEVHETEKSIKPKEEPLPKLKTPKIDWNKLSPEELKKMFNK